MCMRFSVCHTITVSLITPPSGVLTQYTSSTQLRLRGVFEQINTLNRLCLPAPLQGMVPEWELPRGYRVCRSNLTAGSHEAAG